MIYSSVESTNKNIGIRYRLKHFEIYNNTQVSFTGEITAVYKTNHTIEIKLREPPYSTIKVTTNNQGGDPQVGDIVEILGILDDENHVTATRILISERWKHDLIYLRSLPAIPFALYLFFRTWKFNWDTYRFERRKKNA